MNLRTMLAVLHIDLFETAPSDLMHCISVQTILLSDLSRTNQQNTKQVMRERAAAARGGLYVRTKKGQRRRSSK